MQLATVQEAIEAAGFTPRGALSLDPDEHVADVRPGVPARTLVLVGNAGPEMWRRFVRVREPETDLLDDWSREVLTDLARRLGAVALFPFTRPHLPFQRWAERAEPCHPSPLGIFIHADYGLWHGYRGALAFAEAMELPSPEQTASPCETCPDRPCLETCPVGAFTEGSYDVAACARHIGSAAGKDCMEFGCRARRACPVGRGFRYVPPQARFHMTAFLRARRREGVV